MIVHTVNIEAQVEAGASYLDCFKGVELRRTEIACVSFAGQILSGSTFAYVSTVCNVQDVTPLTLLLP